MDTVTVSPKVPSGDPPGIREKMGIHPGERLEVITLDDRIELIPLRPMQEMKGFLKGLDPTFIATRMTGYEPRRYLRLDQYFFEGPNASFFAPPIEEVEELIVPTVCLYEAFEEDQCCGGPIAGPASDCPDETGAGDRPDSGYCPESCPD